MAEYQAMFRLDESDLGGRILGCGDGPASFNAEVSAQGHAVVSVDPLYAVSAAAIEQRVEATFHEVMDEVRRNAEESDLPFEDGAFELALSSHLLFLYSEQFDLAFHIRALEEMLRVATEVRVFPLLQLGGTPSPHVDGVVGALRSRGADVTVEPVEYQFQRGGNRMLRLRPKPTV